MEVFKGEGSLADLLKAAGRASAKGIFVVSGRSSFSGSSASRDVDRLLHGLPVRYFSDFSPNVTAGEALLGCEAFERSGADVILAVGGGSVIDMAKVISVGTADRSRLMDLVRGAAAPVSRAPLYCAPTTAGSGSEATHFAVVYIGREKYSMAGEALLARAVAVDPLLSASMPPYLTACSGFDAVCHAVESWWARGADAESRGYAARALKLLLPNIEEAVTAPTPHARRNMAEGAYWAGRAINVSKTTAPHAFSYHLTSAYSIPHGHAVALALGTFWRVNEPAIPPGLLAALGQPSAGEAGRFWRDLMERCGLETRLSVLGVEPEAAEEMAKSVNAERLGNNPVALDGAGVLDAARRMAAPDGNKPRARD